MDYQRFICNKHYMRITMIKNYLVLFSFFFCLGRIVFRESHHEMCNRTRNRAGCHRDRSRQIKVLIDVIVAGRAYCVYTFIL